MMTWVRHRNALLAAGVWVLAGALGLAVVLKTALYYADTDAVAHGLVWLIGLGMAGGLAELAVRLVRAVGLSNEIASLPSAPTESTLAGVRPDLRAFLQARLDRSPMPASPAAFTPYLVGLLVMLGLLGTFLGLFDTLRGARDALTASGDIEALRQGLAHPMAGLTRSFGSSAAGVSCSALLGLVLVCVRRVEMTAVVQAHRYATGPLQHLSPHQRQHDALLALAEQGRALPAAAEALSGLGASLSGLASEWRTAHAQSAAEMQQALQTAVQTASRELGKAATTSADRLHGHIKPLLEDVIERAAEAADARFEALRGELADDLAARRDAETALREHARQGLGELLELAQAQLSDQRSQQTAALEEQREQQQALLSAQRESQQVQLAEQREAQQTQFALLRESAEGFATTLQQQAGELVVALGASAEGFASTLQRQASELVEALGQAHTRDAEQVERAEQALRGLQEAASAVADNLTAQREQLETLLEQTGSQVSALTATAGEGVADTLRAVRETAEGLGERFASQVQALRDSQASAEQAAIAQAEQTLASLREASTDLSERFAAQVERLHSAQTTAEQAAIAQAEQTLASLREASTDLSERFAAQIQRLEQAQVEGLGALQQELSAHATQGREGLAQAGSTVAEASALLSATTAELSAVAEMFAASVESQREAARAWLENLGELEGAIEQSGREAAADALGDQLAATQEVFARQLQFQKELFEQLRDLRPADVAATPEEKRASA